MKAANNSKQNSVTSRVLSLSIQSATFQTVGGSVCYKKRKMPLQLIKPDSRGVRLNQVKQGFLCQNIRLYQVLECIWSVQSWERRACYSIRNVAPFWGMHFIAFWHRDVSEPSEYQSFCVFVPMELQCK